MSSAIDVALNARTKLMLCHGSAFGLLGHQALGGRARAFEADEASPMSW